MLDLTPYTYTPTVTRRLSGGLCFLYQQNSGGEATWKPSYWSRCHFGEVITVIAVIASLLYVGKQIKQNAEVMQVNALNAQAQRIFITHPCS
jgi:hypothetical protein